MFCVDPLRRITGVRRTLFFCVAWSTRLVLKLRWPRHCTRSVWYPGMGAGLLGVWWGFISFSEDSFPGSTINSLERERLEVHLWNLNLQTLLPFRSVCFTVRVDLGVYCRRDAGSRAGLMKTWWVGRRKHRQGCAGRVYGNSCQGRQTMNLQTLIALVE